MVQLTKLFEPGKIGTMEVKNRLIMAPMGTRSHSPGGFIQPRTVDYYEARAKGGVGLIIVQAGRALRIGYAPGKLGLYDDKFILGMTRVAKAVHKHGAKIAGQLNYHGKLLLQEIDQIPRSWEIRAIAPSAIPWVRVSMTPQEATYDDIEYLLDNWSEAARRIKDAGFDAVEIHGGHGYAITQWLSPRDNKRNDEYGGSPENRARFACKLISRVRQKLGPDFPISFRFSGADFMPGGITLEQSVIQAPLFVKAGADALHVSACEEESTQWQFLSYLFPDGAIVNLAEAIKKVVNVPVITVGKIWDPRVAERILEEGKADFIAMGRALLADPDLPNKAKEGRYDEIRRCIYCNNCLNRTAWPENILKLGGVCTVNPALLREREFEIKPSAKPKRVMVIGGGVAGMEAARVLAERGHLVSLYEKEDKLGGQFAIAAQQPHKEAYASFIEYQQKGLAGAKVNVMLNTEVTQEMIDKDKPEALVVATGATPLVPDIPGVNCRNVVQANDVITARAQVGDRVIVVGARLLGMEVALALAEQGKKVTLTTLHLLGQDGAPLERNLYRALRNGLIDHEVHIFENSPVWEIREDGIYIAFHNELVFLKADTVVLAAGAKPERRLAEELKEAGHCLFEIGDCVQPRDAMQAVREGAEIGRRI